MKLLFQIGLDITLMGIILFSITFMSFSRDAEHPGYYQNIRMEQVAKGWKEACPPDSLLRSGDLVFREGRGFISEAFRHLSLSDDRYSHAGILHFENGMPYVYHVIGGEGAGQGRMRMDPLAIYCDRKGNSAFGIYRLDLNPSELKKLDALATGLYEKGVQFDTHFDLSTDQQLYCTEMVYKLVKQVKPNDSPVRLSSLNGHQFVACDNLYLNPSCKKIYEYHYPSLSRRRFQ